MTVPLIEGPSHHIRNGLQVLELAQRGRKGQGRVLTADECATIERRLWKAIEQLEQQSVPVGQP